MKTIFLSLLVASSLTAAAQIPAGTTIPMGPGDTTRLNRRPAGPRPANMPGTPGDSVPQRQAPAQGGFSIDPATKGNGKISGVLIDSVSNKPVEFATIALLNPETNKPIDGTTTDVDGKFSMTKVAPGKYRLLYSFIGYKDKRSNLITIERGTEIDLRSIKISPDVRTLQEVNVVGQAAQIEEKVDRLVYNAERDITSKGGDASDILRKVPMLSVDMDGNVTLRGSSNIRVLINNKPSTIIASSIADALKQIPSDQIKTVEVITSPSAKYDAEGSGGIINIVLKKNNLQGATLNIDGGVGNRGTNLSLNGNYRTGKMGFSLGGFGRAEYNVKGSFYNDQTTRSYDLLTDTFSEPTRTVQSANTLSQRLFGNYQLGWDYDINKTTSLTASLRYGARNGIQNQYNLLTTTYRPSAYFPTQNDRNVETKDLSGTVDANLTFTKIYKPQKELSVLALFSRNNRTNNFVADILSNADFETITSRQRNDNLSYNQESNLQVDFQTPIKDNQLFEIGAKGVFRNVNSRYQYYLATGADGAYQTDNTRPSNTLIYDQNIAASYLSYTYSSKTKYTIKAGLRYEYTFVNARFSDESTGEADQIPNYGTLVPSVNISKALKGGKIIKLAYNRRIQRPGIQFLNPNTNYSNPTNITMGNPYLAPEFTDNVEFGTSTNIKGLYLNTTLFARRTTGEITAVREVTAVAGQGFGDVVNPVLQQGIITTYQNIGYQDAYGLNLFANGTLFKKLQIGGGIDLYHVNLTNNSDNPIYAASNSGWVVSGRINASMALGNGWAFQLFGGGRGNRVQLQGNQGGMYFYNVGMRKEFNDKRSSLGLAGENIFNHPFTQRTNLSSPILTQSSLNSFYNAGVRLTFSHRIGKMSVDGPRRRRGNGDDSDLKEGEGDQGTGGQGGGNGGNTGGGGGRPRGQR
ncbi:TonB-dependent receptor domain-containing protein [Spirosoma sp. KUDC1026]|uniref:TonB-dependent receptor domain-containing protein n=1 Tax=Spirosoma sp. KUDC1026 TaxID=2745947 RepID=UPI00159BB1D3|nr:TonB-dependent receptor [Spirosoma sp. KUDC1026]QKZ12936.1 TonB-dependent receptor [Spirosoma sp. KUDC1026]